jgi:hypothetical protein
MFRVYKAFRDSVFEQIGDSQVFLANVASAQQEMSEEDGTEHQNRQEKGSEETTDFIKENITTLYNASSVDSRLIRNGLVSIKDLVSRYAPPWLKWGCIDHGLAAGVTILDFRNTLAEIFRTNAEPQKEDRSNVIPSVVRLAIGLGTTGADDVLKYQFDVLCEESAYAITIHNLYPEYLIDPRLKRFRTDMTSEPFAFLALLCDSLQTWDRKKTMNQAFRKLPYATYSDGFDIDIRRNVLFISEMGDQLDIAERSKSLSEHLDKYLKNASHLVRLSLTQWRHATVPNIRA